MIPREGMYQFSEEVLIEGRSTHEYTPWRGYGEYSGRFEWIMVLAVLIVGAAAFAVVCAIWFMGGLG